MANRVRIKQAFSDSNLSIAEWSRERGFSESLVYQVLAAKKLPKRGQSYEIAVALGLVDPSRASVSGKVAEFERKIKEGLSA